MSQFSRAELLIALDRIVPGPASGRLCIAFSGGLDSTVLLHAAAAIAREQSRYSVRAVHVDHQLHPDSTRWQQHCAQTACSLGIDYAYRSVIVDAAAGGLESAARFARYNVFRELMRAGDCLVTAHHADDQLETVLLALMRGAGVSGLAAMPERQSFGAGWHVRPLLEFTREQLHAWAIAEGLHWLTDPSNAGVRFERNYLRHEVIPGLLRRWPAAARSAVRSAAHLADANALINQIAAADVAAAAVGECLSLDRLAALEDLRLRNALRCWLKARGARMPSTRKLLALRRDMFAAQADRTPCVSWDGFEVRRHRGLLYAAPSQLELGPGTQLRWDWREPLALPAGLGTLRVEPVRGAGLVTAKLADAIEVRFRSGGEQLKIESDAHHRKLKKLLQSADVLPWWRDRLPLLFVAGELAAVGDLWIAQEFAAASDEQGVRVVWEGRPMITAVSGRIGTAHVHP